MNRTLEDSLTVGTSLGRAFRYLLFGAAAVLLGLMFCGCQTQKPPPGWQSPPVIYGRPLPQGAPVWAWEVREELPAHGVRLEWSYPETNMAFIVFRVYGSERPTWDTNWTGWYCVGETPGLEFSRAFGPIRPGAAREFYTLTASNTLTGLESDPARRK